LGALTFAHKVFDPSITKKAKASIKLRVSQKAVASLSGGYRNRQKVIPVIIENACFVITGIV
jgi:hypothetical protein